MGRSQPQPRRYHLQLQRRRKHDVQDGDWIASTSNLVGVLFTTRKKTLPKPTCGSMNRGSGYRRSSSDNNKPPPPNLTTGPRIVPSRRASESPLGTAVTPESVSLAHSANSLRMRPASPAISVTTSTCEAKNGREAKQTLVKRRKKHRSQHLVWRFGETREKQGGMYREHSLPAATLAVATGTRLPPVT